MVHAREKQIDDVFFALSHPVRRGIVDQLAKGDLSVSDVSRGFSESPSQMTKHLQLLERAGILSREKKGRVHQLHFEHEPLEEMMVWVSRYQNFWEDRFDALGNYLQKISEEK